jgi:hypothetical protein
MIIDKGLILSEIKLHYNFKVDADFARFLGISPQTLYSWYGHLDSIENIRKQFYSYQKPE